MRVKDVMQKEVTTLDLADNLDVADDIMTLGRVRHLPVVDSKNRLVGIVSQRDLLKASVASVLNLDRTVEHDWLKAIPVRLAMIGDVSTVTPDTPLNSALTIMITKKIGCLPVVHDGILVGLLTETDCLEILARLLGGERADVWTH
jgi:CBS domain-containing membrane protein